MNIRLVAIALLACMLLVGCGTYSSPTESTEFVGIALCGNENWDEYPVADALESRLTETEAFRVDLECAGEKEDVQREQLRIMLANHPRAIVVTYVEGADLSDMTTMIKAAGVPLIEMDREACRTSPDNEMMRIYNEIMSSFSE